MIDISYLGANSDWARNIEEKEKEKEDSRKLIQSQHTTSVSSLTPPPRRIVISLQRSTKTKAHQLFASQPTPYPHPELIA